MLILGITLGAIAYLNIGYHLIGKPSRSVWKYGGNRVMEFLLFPINALTDDVGSRGDALIADEFDDDRTYYRIMAIIWPLKVAWSAVVCTVAGALLGLWHGGRGLISLATEGPGRLMEAVGAKLTQLREAREEYRRLEAQAQAADEARFRAELEAIDEGDYDVPAPRTRRRRRSSTD